MRKKLFENHIKKFLPNCFNNLTLESQDYIGIERAQFSRLPPPSLVYRIQADSSDGRFLGVSGRIILFMANQIITGVEICNPDIKYFIMTPI